MGRSLAGYLEGFLQKGSERAYTQPVGYRTIHWTYKQVGETAFQFARELGARGIGKGERVLLWGPNSAEWVAAFFGCVLQGVVVVPMDDAAAADFAQRVAAADRGEAGGVLTCPRGDAVNSDDDFGEVARDVSLPFCVGLCRG